MHSPKYFQELLEKEIHALDFPASPSELYDPIRYILSLGAKRLRPCLVLMSNELFGGVPEKALAPALGIEVFHNFTLMHDDIMDRAPLRRGKETVHTKWNSNIAILSGDTMFVKSCQMMMQAPENCRTEILDLFLKTAAEVCEGQQIDMNFENREDVRIPEYLEMISLKTAVLLACSLRVGAILAAAGKNDAERIYRFGKNLGIAFQLHDDILDLYAESEKFGKQVGGDILSRKKTILLLQALASNKSNEVADLKKWMSSDSANHEEKIAAVRNIFQSLDVRRKSEEVMEKYFRLAMNELEQVQVDAGKKVALTDLAERLMVREV
jgi:geranylgeranyl diphosphate synthase type II